METQHGLPIVRASNLAEALRELGIQRWKRLSTPETLDSYLARPHTPEDRAWLRFAPKSEVVPFEDPRGGVFHGLRASGPHGVAVFSLLPGDLIPVCAEFRHGCEDVFLNLPGGRSEENDPAACAKREFEEETGIPLLRLTALSTHGVPIDARCTNRRNFFYLGHAAPPPWKAPELDEGEFLRTVLVPLPEWLKLIESETAVEGYSIAATFLALRRLEGV